MKKLEEPINLDTGLKHKGKPVTIQIMPSASGGALVFECGMKRRRIPLAQILANVTEPAHNGTTDEDLVCLRDLEPRFSIMVFDAPDDAAERARYSAKCAVLACIREMRDERREETGLPPVRWRGTQKEWEAQHERKKS